MPPFPRFIFAAALSCLCASTYARTASPKPAIISANVESVDPGDRAAVLRLYRRVYQADQAIPAGSANHIAEGQPDAVSPAPQEATLRRINYFRVMSGLPGDIVFDPLLSARAQQAALMMAANNSLNHFPPRTWRHYTAVGAEAASHAVLTLGTTGPAAVDDCIREPGDRNKFVGHRRWLLYPPQKMMGGGSVDEAGLDHRSAAGAGPPAKATAVWTAGPFKYRPPVPERFVAWPPPGYVPAPLVYPRWSLSYPAADFSAATVRVLKRGAEIPVALETPKPDAAGDNTLVWTLPGNQVSSTADQPYKVIVDGVRISRTPRRFVYQTISCNP